MTDLGDAELARTVKGINLDTDGRYYDRSPISREDWLQYSPMDFARWEKGPEATYEDPLALYLKIERRSWIYYIYISGVPQAILPSRIE